MLRIRSLRASPLILALVLAACGGESATTAPQGASADTAPASEPVASSEPVPEPASPPVDAATAAEAVPQGGGNAEAGEQTYQKTCAMCHGSPAMGAPVAGNKDDWKDRIAQGKDTLYAHALEGFTGAKGMMPARGGNPSLDDASVKAAVDHMIAKSQ